MPRSKKKLPKKIINKKGSSKTPLLITIVVLATTAIVGGMFLFAKSRSTSSSKGLFAERPKITLPSPDMARARQLTINPDEETIMQIQTKEKVTITLTIPKGSLNEKTTIKMIPYYYDEKSQDPSAGVIIGPGTLEFNHPVTLLFDLSESSLRTDAPANRSKMDQVRMNGTSQVLMLDQNATELIPALVAREVETSTQLRARILTGGGYVFSVDGKDQDRWAKNAFKKEKINAISILESAKVLLSSKEKMSKDDLGKAQVAAEKILAKKNPTPHEFVAALSVMKLLSDEKTSFVPKAYAAENDPMTVQRVTPRGVIEFMCKEKGLPVEAYVAYGAAAWNYGYGDLRDKCMTVALNKAADDARKLLRDPNASIKSMLIAVKNLQFLGIDEVDELADKLFEKIKWKAEDEAKRVAYDIDATPIEIATELQKLQTLGVDEGRTQEILNERLMDKIKEVEDNIPTPPPDDYEVESEYSEEQVLLDQAWTIIGIEVLKMMGFTEFDQESIQKRFDEMRQGAEMLNEAVYPLCKEFGGENCDQVYNQSKQDIEKAAQESYRVSSEIGRVQNSEFETPDYDDYGAHYSFELTPTPDEEYYMELNEDDQDEEESYDDIYYEDPLESQSTEDDNSSESQDQDSSNQFFEESQESEDE